MVFLDITYSLTPQNPGDYFSYADDPAVDICKWE